MSRYKIEAIVKALADTQSKVAELEAQLAEAEKAGDSCSEWLLSNDYKFKLNGTGSPWPDASVSEDYAKRGRATNTEEQAKQLDDNQLLYMRIVRAIAAENKKVGYVAKFDGLHLNHALSLDSEGHIESHGWSLIQALPDFHYMHQSVVPKIRGQFSDEELTTFIKKAMLL